MPTAVASTHWAVTTIGRPEDIIVTVVSWLGRVLKAKARQYGGLDKQQRRWKDWSPGSASFERHPKISR